MKNLVEVKNLKKKYGFKEAVKGISFSIKENEILGLLGPNGSGKTTTIGMMLGLLKPSNGEILIDGKKIEESRIETLQNGETKTIELKGDISSLDNDNSLDLKIKIYHKRRMIGEFKNHWKISRTLIGDDLHSLEILGNSEDAPIGKVIKGFLIPLVKTVQDPYFQKKYPEYYITKSRKGENVQKGLDVIIFKKRQKSLFGYVEETQKSFMINLKNLNLICTLFLTLD